MILVLFFCVIVILVMLIVILLLLSTIRVKVKDFELSNKKHIEPNYEIIISLILLNKLKWISIRLNNAKMRKMYTKMHLERIDIKELEKNIKPSDIREIINIKPKLTHLNLKLKLGIEDVILTSYIVPIFCTFICIVLPHVTEKKNIGNIKYKIEPVYNQNMYHIKLGTIIEIKMINVLNSVYKIYKSKKEKTKAKNKIRVNKITDKISSLQS